MSNVTRLEWIGKYAAIVSALVAIVVGIGQYRRGVSQSMRELEWRQADMARTMLNAMMNDEGWQAMTMLDWEEGRTYEIAPGTLVRILPDDVPVAIAAALRKNGRRRTETQRFITDRYDLFLFNVSQLQAAVRSGLVRNNRTTAEAVARSVGIDQVEADVLPDRKAAVVKRLQERGERVAMAGDGVNDAPALAAADVGIAMGTGTDIAIESAGVTLVKGDLRGIVRARRLSKATMSNIRQNLFFAFVYHVLGVPVAAGVLYPFLGLLLSPMIASAAMTFSSVSVIGNALRLRRISL